MRVWGWLCRLRKHQWRMLRMVFHPFLGRPEGRLLPLLYDADCRRCGFQRRQIDGTFEKGMHSSIEIVGFTPDEYDICDGRWSVESVLIKAFFSMKYGN